MRGDTVRIDGRAGRDRLQSCVEAIAHDHPPGVSSPSLRSMLRALATWYFRPRNFESSALYPILGVRIYKRFVPTSGEWISRLRGIDRLKISTTGSRRVALQNYELQTRTWEWRHLASAIFLQSWAFIGGVAVGVEQFWACSAINLLVNVYPIMVQRFNRARIALILRREPRPLSSATRIGTQPAADEER